MKVSKNLMKGESKLSVAETLNLMINFAIYTIALISLIVKIVLAIIKKDK